jgi:hypothetical protein
MFGVVTWRGDGEPITCACGNLACVNNAGKHPRIKWSDLPPDAGRRVHYWRWRFHDSPDNPLNWAFHLGLSGVLGLDVDPRNGGTESWAALVEKYGQLPPTPLEHVPTRGWHAYLAAPPADQLPQSTHVEIAPGVELKWGNNYFIGPPSVHRCGHAYQWITRPWEQPFAPASRWLIDLANETAGKAKAVAAQRYAPVASGGVPLVVGAAGEQIVERARAYLDTIPPGIQGQSGSKPTYRAACVLVQGFGLSIEQALPLLQEYSARCVPPWSDRELMHKLEDAACGSARGYLLDSSRLRKPSAIDREIAPLEGVEIILRRRPRAPSAPPSPATAAATTTALAALIAAEFSDEVLEQLAAQAEADRQAGDTTTNIASATFRPAHPRRCPHVSCVFHEHRFKAEARVMMHPCRRLRCEVCGKVKREQWKATVRHHLGRLPAASTVYRFRCDSDDWPRLYAQIRRRRGSFFRLDYATDGGLFLVVSTVPVAGVDRVETTTPGAATASLGTAIDCLPPLDRRKVFYSSHDWPVLEEESDQTGQWKRIGKLPNDPRALHDILNSYGIEPEFKQRKRFRWWQWTAWQFRTDGIDVLHLYLELCAGERLESFNHGKDADDRGVPSVIKTGPTTFCVQL